MLKKLSVFALIGLISAGTNAQASTYYAGVVRNDVAVTVPAFCAEDGSSEVAVGCSAVDPNDGRRGYSGFARAENGSVGVSGSAFNSGVRSDIKTDSLAVFSDVLTFGIEDGFLELPIDISGSLSSITNSSRFSRAEVFFRLVLGSGQTSIFQSFVGSANPTETTPVGNYGVNTVFLPFSGGQLYLESRLFGSAACGGQTEGESCTTQFDFSSSANFLAASVLDVDMNEALGASISSASGFDYSVGYVVAPVPLPAAMPLLIASFGGLVLVARRRKAS